MAGITPGRIKRKLSHLYRKVIGGIARHSPIKIAGFGYPNRILEKAAWLSEPTAAGLPAYVRSVQILPEREIRQVPAPRRIKSTDPLLWEWTQNWKPRTRYVVTLDKARVNSNAIIAPDHTILWELSFLWNMEPARHPLLHYPVLPPATHLAGRSLFLGVDTADNYFHWQLDLLPKFKVLKDAGIDYLGFDYYLVNSQKYEFQQESLRRLGIPAAKIVSTSQVRHILTDTLVAPSWADQSGIFDPADVDWLRSQLMAPEHNGKTPFPKRIFISRQKTRGRNVRNFEALQPLLKKHKIEIVELEPLRFSQQIQLFNGAEMVIGAHGAGLTNLLFCRSGTRVLELVSPHFAHQMYYYLAAVRGLDHRYLVGQVEPGEEPIFQDLTVDVDEISRTLDAWSSAVSPSA
jgi:hypothetical protein